MFPWSRTRQFSSRPRGRGQDGAASVEQVGLISLVALVFAVLVAAVAAHGPIDGGRQVGSLIGRRLACAPLAEGPCRTDRLLPAYGDDLARLARALAPDIGEMQAALPAGVAVEHAGLVPVDFRYCRQASCATPLPGERGEWLTASNRRVTAFTEVRDRRRIVGQVEVVYWLYRPLAGWSSITRVADREAVAAAASTHLGRDESPVLVPLETLAGRNHTRFRRAEEPPWRWRVESHYPGRPAQ